MSYGHLLNFYLSTESSNMGETESVHWGRLAPSPVPPPIKTIGQREETAIQKAAHKWLQAKAPEPASSILPTHDQLKKVLEFSHTTKQFDDLIMKVLRLGSSDRIPSHEQVAGLKDEFFSLPVDAWKGVLQFMQEVCTDPRVHTKNVRTIIRGFERQVRRAHDMAKTLEREYPKLLLRTEMTDEQVQHFSHSLAHIPGADLKLLYSHISHLQQETLRHKFLQQRIGPWETLGTDKRVKENVEKLMQAFQPLLPYLQFLKKEKTHHSQR